MVIPKGDHVPTFPLALRLQRRQTRTVDADGLVGRFFPRPPTRPRPAARVLDESTPDRVGVGTTDSGDRIPISACAAMTIGAS